MRPRQIVLLGLLVTAPAFARADDTCDWKDSGKPSHVFVQDGIAILRTYYSPSWAACASAADKAVEVQWLFAGDPTAAPLHTEKVQLHPGRDTEPMKLEARLFRGQVCDKPRPEKLPKKLVTTGMPGHEEVVELVPLQAHVKASGALSPLDYTSPIVEMPCSACRSSGSGSLSVARADNERDLILEGTFDAQWFECARRDATLSLLAFAGASERDVSTAIQPDLVLDGLEKEIVRKGNAYVLRKPLPMARLCAKKARFWTFEVWGRGELMHAGGGGREIEQVRCD